MKERVRIGVMRVRNIESYYPKPPNASAIQAFQRGLHIIVEKSVGVSARLG